MTGTPFRHLVAVGETMAAVAPDPAVPLAEAESFRIVAAGAESNVAACAAQLGLSSSWVSRLGDDPLGRRIVAALAACGVDTSRVQFASDAPTGVMLKDPSGATTGVHYYRAGSAASRMSPSDVPALFASLPDGAVLHASGVTPALSEGCRRLVENLVVERSTAAALVSFDVNHRPALWAGRSAAIELLRLADASDVCFVGLDEAHALWDTLDASAVRRVLARPRLLVVKDGATGVTVFDADRRIDVAARPTAIVEAVGAGDAFAGGFLAAFAASGDPRFAARVGHVTAGNVLRSTSDVVSQPALPELAGLADLTDEEWAAWTQETVA